MRITNSSSGPVSLARPRSTLPRRTTVCSARSTWPCATEPVPYQAVWVRTSKAPNLVSCLARSNHISTCQRAKAAIGKATGD